MSNGILLSILSGFAFGLFQTINRKAGRQADVYQATFVLLLVSAVVLTAVSLLSPDIALLQNLSWLAVFYFSLAAMIHFFIGWTLLSASQKKIGAARTSALLGTVPLWAAGIGVLFFDEFLSLLIGGGILLIFIGTYIVSSGKNVASNSAIETGFKASLYGLGTAVCFAGSSIPIRYGFALLDSPILGVTIGMIVVTILYGIVLWAKPPKDGVSIKLRGANLNLQIIAGILVAVATWWRWVSLDLAPIAVVIALSRISVPTVLLISPFFIGQKWEQVTTRVWVGAGLIVAGALILTFA